MALSSSLNKKVFTASAAQTAFAFGDVLYFDQTHLEVYVDCVLKTLSTHYTVSPTTNTPNGTPGGTVTFLTPMVGGEQVIILRVVPLVQSIDYQENEKFPANTHEKGLDYLTMAVQQHYEKLGRQLTLPVVETGTPTLTTLPSLANRAGKFFAWDASGNPIAASVLSSGTPASTYIQTLLDDTTAAAARATLGVNSATSSAEGLVELATDAEAAAMTDAVRALTPANLAYLSSLGLIPSTGDAKITWKKTAYSGWVLANDGTIGNGSSGATNRANADCQALFTLLWNNYSDILAPVIGGRGASAAADWAANKQIRLLRAAGRVLAGLGAAVSVESGTHTEVNTGNDTLTVASNSNKWITGMPVVLTFTGTLGGLTSGNTYYVYRNSSTTIKLCSSLANAQNGTVIDITSASGLAWTITYTDPDTHVAGEHGGEHAHAMSATELLAHGGHTNNTNGASGGAAFTGSGTTGGNAAMNIVQPTSYWTIQVKL